ncbi:hypothetical protein FOXYSP1_19036 [Fusarium oxysporum f. sp. phaseoli]
MRSLLQVRLNCRKRMLHDYGRAT